MAKPACAAARELEKVKDRWRARKGAEGDQHGAGRHAGKHAEEAEHAQEQKQEEAESRRQVEAALNTLRAEKRQQDKKAADAARNAATLVTRYRDCTSCRPSCTSSSSAGRGREGPAGASKLDTELVEAIEKPAA